MNAPDEDCLQAISNALSYSTPKSYDSLLSSSLLPEQALADQSTLYAHDAPAQSHPDIITKGVTVQPMMYEELLTTSQHKESSTRFAHASNMRNCT